MESTTHFDLEHTTKCGTEGMILKSGKKRLWMPLKVGRESSRPDWSKPQMWTVPEEKKPMVGSNKEFHAPRTVDERKMVLEMTNIYSKKMEKYLDNGGKITDKKHNRMVRRYNKLCNMVNLTGDL